MVVAAVAPDLDSLAVLLVLWLQIRVRVHAIGCLHSEHVCSIILSEHAEIGCSVLLPEAFEDIICGCSEHSNAACLTIDPVAFERASIWPYQLSIPALVVLVVDHRFLWIVRRITLLKPVLLACIHS